MPWSRLVGGALPVLISASALTPQLFDVRPIWSRNAVRTKISVHPDKLKVLLPFMAYYMVSVCPAATWFPQDVLSPDGTCQSRSESRRPCPTSPRKVSAAPQEHVRPFGMISGLKSNFITSMKRLYIFK